MYNSAKGGENTDNPCVIYCYTYDNYQIKWTAERFECNINEMYILATNCVDERNKLRMK